MPRLLALVAAAAAIALAAGAASAQQAPGTPGALIYGGNGSVTVDGTAINGATIVATDANGNSVTAAWDTVGWSVEVLPNSEISFTVNSAPVADSITSGRAGSVQPATLAAVTPTSGDDLLGANGDGDGADDGSMMDGGDDANGDDLLGGDEDDGGDLLGADEDDGSMMDDGSDDGDNGSMMDDGSNGDDDGSMSQLPVSGTGGLLGAGGGTDAWVFGLSGVLVLLGLAGAFAAHRKTTHTA